MAINACCHIVMNTAADGPLNPSMTTATTFFTRQRTEIVLFMFRGDVGVAIPANQTRVCGRGKYDIFVTVGTIDLVGESQCTNHRQKNKRKQNSQIA